jgi:shikimate dehydrogenase
VDNDNIFGLLGYPLGHSLSPAIHNCIYKYYGINATYKLFEEKETDIESIVEKIRHKIVNGINVTIPYKQKIIGYLDHIDNESAIIGAVNTVTNENGIITGYNTDYLGFTKSLLYNGIDTAGMDVFIIGAGGGARSVALSLINANSMIYVFARNMEKASGFCKSFINLSSSIKFYDLNSISDHIRLIKPYMVVNCTPAGMKGYNGRIPLNTDDIIGNTSILYDLIYNPPITEFLTLGLSCGCNIISGMDMLILQAFEAVKIWFGTEVDFSYGKKLLLKEGIIKLM